MLWVECWPAWEAKHKAQQSQWAAEAGRAHNGPRMTGDVPIVSTSSPPVPIIGPFSPAEAQGKLGQRRAGKAEWPRAGSLAGGVHSSPHVVLLVSFQLLIHSLNKHVLGTHDALRLMLGPASMLDQWSYAPFRQATQGDLRPSVGQILPCPEKNPHQPQPTGKAGCAPCLPSSLPQIELTTH